MPEANRTAPEVCYYYYYYRSLFASLRFALQVANRLPNVDDPAALEARLELLLHSR